MKLGRRLRKVYRAFECPHFARLFQISSKALGRASREICEEVRSLFARNGVASSLERVGQVEEQLDPMSDLKNDLIRRVKENSSAKIAVALSAHADKGKTTVLKLFADSFRNHGGRLVSAQSMKNREDELWCFEYNDVIVGIATGGDKASMIDEAFDFFRAYDCKIVFCATRLYSKSPSWVRFVERCNLDSYERQWTGINRHSAQLQSAIQNDFVENILFKSL